MYNQFSTSYSLCFERRLSGNEGAGVRLRFVIDVGVVMSNVLLLLLLTMIDER